MPAPKKLTLTVPEAAKRIGIGENQAYEAIKQNQIPAIHIGRRVLVPIAALENWLANAGNAQK